MIDYIWDTKEQQGKSKPYGFVDFPKDLLQIYFKKRKEALNFLENTPDLYKDFDKSTIEVYSIEDLMNLPEFNTRKTIMSLYLMIEEQKSFTNKKAFEHYKRILKKVELKKLRQSYDSGFINTSNQEVSLQGKAYLSLTMALHALTPNMQSLSTLSKLNDFLISEKTSLGNLEKALVYNSVKIEKYQITKIARQKGVLK